MGRTIVAHDCRCVECRAEIHCLDATGHHNHLLLFGLAAIIDEDHRVWITSPGDDHSALARATDQRVPE